MRTLFYRLAYSFLQFIEWSDDLFEKGVNVMLMPIYKLFYYGNPNGRMRRKYKSFDDYLKFLDSTYNHTIKNARTLSNKGKAEAAAVSVVFGYLLLINSLLKMFRLLPRPVAEAGYFYSIVMAMILACLLSTYAYAGNTRERYFRKYARQKNIRKWHVATLIATIGAIAAFFLSLHIWYHC